MVPIGRMWTCEDEWMLTSHQSVNWKIERPPQLNTQHTKLSIFAYISCIFLNVFTIVLFNLQIYPNVVHFTCLCNQHALTQREPIWYVSFVFSLSLSLVLSYRMNRALRCYRNTSKLCMHSQRATHRMSLNIILHNLAYVCVFRYGQSICWSDMLPASCLLALWQCDMHLLRYDGLSSDKISVWTRRIILLSYVIWSKYLYFKSSLIIFTEICGQCNK